MTSKTTDNVYIIFEKLYPAKVPIISTYNEVELDLYGIPYGSVNGKLEDMSKDLVSVEITVNRMVEMFENGFQILLPNADDITEIYMAIQNHIHHCQNVIRRSPNKNTQVPEEDLIRLDAFAKAIFDVNKQKIVRDHMDIDKNMFGNKLRGRMMRPDGKINSQEAVQHEDIESINHIAQIKKSQSTRKYSLQQLLGG